VVDDNRLAITEGHLVRVGQDFLVYNGIEITPVKDEDTDCLTVSVWGFRGQLRRFRLKNTVGMLEIGAFQVCNEAKVFYQCMPEKWKSEPVRIFEVDQNHRQD
jgi:hypothetical protein